MSTTVTILQLPWHLRWLFLKSTDLYFRISLGFYRYGYRLCELHALSSRLRLDTKNSVLLTSPCRVPSSVCDWLFFGFEFSHAFIDQSEGTVELRHQYGIFRRFSGVSSARKDFRAPRQNSVSRDYVDVKGKIAPSYIILVQLFL